MNRLQRELLRLYLPQGPKGQQADLDTTDMIDAGGRVRAMVLELARPADWAALSKVWNGVQIDLALPAPAIAVSGKDGYQLWFSLAEPVSVAAAMAFLELIRLRYLNDVQTQGLSLFPTLDTSPAQPARHASLVPAQQAGSGGWSAFVAPDLAPVFAGEPWLDLPPSLDGQSNLLARLESMQAVDFERVLAQLGPAPIPAPAQPTTDPAMAAGPGTGPTDGTSAPGSAGLDPKRFLLDVMNNDTVALGLRVEAAKALLPYFDDPWRP